MQNIHKHAKTYPLINCRISAHSQPKIHIKNEGTTTKTCILSIGGFRDVCGGRVVPPFEDALIELFIELRNYGQYKIRRTSVGSVNGKTKQ